MSELLIGPSEGTPLPLHALRKRDLEDFLQRRRPAVKAQVEVAEFKAKASQVCVVLGGEGRIERALIGLGEEERSDPMILRAAPVKLPGGDWRLQGGGLDPVQAALAWALGGYVFDRYKPRSEKARPRLVLRSDGEVQAARRLSHACALARDMVNTPANDMGPLQIETVVREVGERYGAAVSVITGEALHEENYPAVLAVGRAAEAVRAPRMIELTWGEAGAPLIAVVGKGVSFDTGGLDLKPSSGMRLMKKDMGGAAHAIALARLVMDASLPVRLVLLVPAVENSVSGEAMRPGDVIATRKGLTVEVGNTDAEGRLILADALARAAELEPELTFDFATLTGAARVALGPQLPPFYTGDDQLARQLEAAAAAVSDPMWRMPLWAGYVEALEGEIADLKNDPDGWAQAGSVTAALFLKRFAPVAGWTHFDIFAWNPKSRPGWPVGAEAQAVRAVFHLLGKRFR